MDSRAFSHTLVTQLRYVSGLICSRTSVNDVPQTLTNSFPYLPAWQECSLLSNENALTGIMMEHWP